jgi:ATP-dependent RNA helicase RhlE
LARQLEKDGLKTTAIHGDKSQVARLEALDDFKGAKVQVMVATDVAARGLDIDDLPLVINYELPYVPEDYIHRIGRTGRAGATGQAISFCAPEEEKLLGEIERMLKRSIPVMPVEGFTVASDSPPARRTSSDPPHAKRPQQRAAAPRDRIDRASDDRSRARVAGVADDRNPDQLPIARKPEQSSVPTALTSHAPKHHSRRPSRPVAALLLRRPAKESEKV